MTAGLGQPHGLLGLRYTYRMPEYFAFSGGIGAIGVSAAARVHPIGPLFAEVNFAPLLSDGTWNSLYGPGVAAGVDLVRTRFAFTFELGYALITPRVGATTLDLAFGVNFGERHPVPEGS